MAELIWQLDRKLDEILQGWNSISVLLSVALLIYVVYPLITYREPDTHPLLLCRQTNGSPVRQPGESAIYRSPEVPPGYPLRSGLDVKDPGASRWSSGRDGDLRDIWWKARKGAELEDGQATGEKGTLITVHGQDNVETTTFAEASTQIYVLGSYIKSREAGCVALCLPNSVEMLVCIFAASFFGFHIALLPYDEPPDVVIKLLPLTDADFLITSAGTLPLTDLKKNCPKVKHVLYVVENTSRHLNWSDQSQDVSVWHEIMETHGERNSAASLEKLETPTLPSDILTIWMNDSSSSGEIVRFSQGNIVAAVAAQISAIPRKHRMSSSDLYFPADCLTTPYILVQAFAALFSNASIALNSVSGPEVELPMATNLIAPTIISCSASTLIKLHRSATSRLTSFRQRYALRSKAKALASGFMPKSAPLMTLGTFGNEAETLQKSALRLIYCHERAHAGTPPVNSKELSDIRALTGARVIYALTAAKVAGSVAQTGYFDYRIDKHQEGKYSHFGIPPSSVELKMVDRDDFRTTNDKAQGEIVVTGPAVFEGTVKLNVIGTVRDDGTLCYVK